MGRNRQQKKSPLKTKPLRAPGQSLSEQRDDVLYDKLLVPAMIGIVMLLLAGLEWFRWFTNSPPRPVIASLMALVVCLWVAWRIRRQLPYVRQLSLGLRGEKVVGQCLERLRAKGYDVFHDIVGDGHNIDHALVGPGGVFVIETKTVRKPSRGESEVVFDGESISVNGLSPDRDPVVQVKAAAREMAAIIRATTGRDLFVRPVVLYPGWYTKQPKRPQIWVLNENAFPKFLANEDQALEPDEVTLIGAGIAMRVRGTE